MWRAQTEIANCLKWWFNSISTCNILKTDEAKVKGKLDLQHDDKRKDVDVL